MVAVQLVENISDFVDVSMILVNVYYYLSPSIIEALNVLCIDFIHQGCSIDVQSCLADDCS